VLVFTWATASELADTDGEAVTERGEAIIGRKGEQNRARILTSRELLKYTGVSMNPGLPSIHTQNNNNKNRRFNIVYAHCTTLPKSYD